MLKNINLESIIKNSEDEFLKIMTDEGDGKEVIPGIYITGLNSHYFFADEIIDEYESFVDEENYRGNYGVCDNYSQILKEYPELENCTERHFVVLLTPIRKSEQEREYGWRWHKWGEYIGEQKPTREFLYDEPAIELVYVYHIYEVR